MQFSIFLKSAILLLAVILSITAPAAAREQIQIVGSSTVFPFSSVVAERFGRSSKYRIPIVESTGTGGGMKLLCAGIGKSHPDIANASRRIKKSEYDQCRQNGINLTEVKIGFDGIVIAHARDGIKLKLTRQQIFLALAARVPFKGKLAKNPYKKWSDISKNLPNVKIEVLGPPPTSGTRDAFVEQAMENGAKTFKPLAALAKKNEKRFKAIAHAMREDGAFVEAGENDNLIIQKLTANKNALGIFGFSFLDNNSDKIQGVDVENWTPSFENIVDGNYPIARPLFFYVKKNHADIIPGLRRFIKEFTSARAWGDDGYLSERGLIPLPQAERDQVARQAQSLSALKF